MNAPSQSKRRLPLLENGLAALLLLSTCPLLAERQLIISVTGPIAKQLRPGTFLPEGKAVKLGIMDHIVVVDGKGARGFSGPQNRILTRTPARVEDGKDWVKNLITAPDPLIRLAGMRGVKAAQLDGENPFFTVIIPAKVGGPICFASRSTLFLQRMSRDQVAVEVRPNAPAKPETMTFPGESAAVRWPTSLLPAAQSSRNYQIRDLKIRSRPRVIKLVHIQNQGLGWVEYGQSLTRQRCSNSDWLVAMKDWEEASRVVTVRPSDSR